MTTALPAQTMDLAGDLEALFESLDREVRQRLHYRVVEELEPITQRHDIEWLVRGVES